MPRVPIIGGCDLRSQYEVCNYCRRNVYGYFVKGTYEKCTCDSEQLCNYIMVLVYVDCFVKKPHEISYIIRIWSGQEVLNMKGENYDRVVYNDPDYEFMLECTDDPSDMEHLYADICKKYHLSEINFSLLRNKQNFKARYSPKSYLLDFESRLKTLISSTERKTEQEAPHMSRRKKGHSHVVKKKK